MKLLLLLFAGGCIGQKTGTLTANSELNLQLQECTGAGSCTPQSTQVTLDSNWRWLHQCTSATNCYTGNLWDNNLCPDAATCTQNCCLEGVATGDWAGTYGIQSDGQELTLKFVTVGPYATNIGSRTFLLEAGGTEYKIFKLLNREFTFDVDVSQLPCGLNGALYFVEMDKDGGASKHPTNQGGAAYGTGYCDAQCPHDMKYISGEANSEGWEPSADDPNSGTGHYGTCCVELDIWEANSLATAFTPHPCNTIGPVRCEGVDCGDNKSGNRYDGVCDKDGCDFHSWRLGDKTFFGPGPEFKVDSTKKMTVVTQFLTSDGSDTGEFVEMRRLYVQDGKIIQNSVSNVNGVTSADSVTASMCTESKSIFQDFDDFSRKGGLKNVGEAMARGMVLVMSLWDDHDAHMLWLDGERYPIDKDPSIPGVNRGPCALGSGVPSEVENNSPNSNVKFSNIKVGTIGSTYPGGFEY